MDFDALFRAVIQLPAEQQTRLVFELAGRLGVAMQREVSGELRMRIQESAAKLEQRGGPLIADQLAELGAPRQARPAEPAQAQASQAREAKAQAQEAQAQAAQAVQS